MSCECCNACAECDLPTYLGYFFPFINYCNYISGVVSPSSALDFNAQSIEYYTNYGEKDYWTSTLNPGIQAQLPHPSVGFSIEWQKRVVPTGITTTQGIQNFYYMGLPSSDFGNAVKPIIDYSFGSTPNDIGLGYLYQRQPAKIDNIDGGADSLRHFYYSSQVTETCQHSGTLPASLLKERVYIDVVTDESKFIELSGSKIYGVTPTGEYSKIYVTVVNSGEPYTMKFECKPSAGYESGVVNRRYGLGAIGSKETLTEYPGAKSLSTPGYGYLFYPPNIGYYEYARGGYDPSLPKTKWILTQAWHGEKDDIIEYVEKLPNGIPLNAGAACLTVKLPGDSSNLGPSIPSISTTVNSQCQTQYYCPVNGNFYTIDQLNDLTLDISVSINASWPGFPVIMSEPANPTSVFTVNNITGISASQRIRKTAVYQSSYRSIDAIIDIAGGLAVYNVCGSNYCNKSWETGDVIASFSVDIQYFTSCINGGCFDDCFYWRVTENVCSCCGDPNSPLKPLWDMIRLRGQCFNVNDINGMCGVLGTDVCGNIMTANNPVPPCATVCCPGCGQTVYGGTCPPISCVQLSRAKIIGTLTNAGWNITTSSDNKPNQATTSCVSVSIGAS